MRNFLLILLCFTCVAECYGQSSIRYGEVVVEITKRKKDISVNVYVKPDLSDTDPSWVQWINRNIDQSIRDVKRFKKGKYIVTAAFIVSKDGSIFDVHCTNDPGFGLCEAVVRILKKSSRWGPAKANPVVPYSNQAKNQH